MNESLKKTYERGGNVFSSDTMSGKDMNEDCGSGSRYQLWAKIRAHTLGQEISYVSSWVGMGEVFLFQLLSCICT